MSTPIEIARTYFDAWGARDYDALRSVLADDVSFRGPLGSADDAESAMGGLRGMAEMTTHLEIRKMIADGPDVMTWFDLETTLAPSVPTVNWSHVEGDRITRIRVAFDARELAAAMGR